MSNHPQVLVVGAGPAGLVAALTLAHNGVNVRIIEKDSLPRVGQRGAAISPRSLELFESIGILKDVQQRGLPGILPVRSYLQLGNMEDYKEFIVLPHEDPTPTDPYRDFVCLGQDGLDRIMRSKLSECGFSVDYGIELISLKQLDNRVKVVLQVTNNDSTGVSMKVEETYQYVIGADGGRGVVRKQLGLQFLGDNLKIGMAIGDIKVEGLSGEYWHMWGKMEDDLFLGVRGTENPGVFNFILGGSKFESGEELCQDQHLLLSFLTNHSIGAREDVKITEILCAAPYTPTVRMVDVFRKGNVFVAGDAAHVHSPAGGQGMNTGLQDGFNLAWKIAMVCKEWSPKSLLDTYNEERLPVVARMLNITSSLMDAMTKSTDNETGWKRAGAGINQLGVNYRWSSIVVDEGNQSTKEKEVSDNTRSAYGGIDYLRAGDRAPDAPGLQNMNAQTAETTRLFKLFAPTRHTLVVLSSSAEDARHAIDCADGYKSGAIKVIRVVASTEVEIDSHPNPCDTYDTYEDTRGYVHDTYSKAEGKAKFVVIRPDGVIGAIVENVEWLEKYFSGIFL